jgi:hypothetical protein
MTDMPFPSGPVVVTPLGGENAETELLSFVDGTHLVRKRISAADAVAMTDAEELGAQVLRALGLRAPRVQRTGEREVHMDYIDGIEGEAFTSPAGRIAPRFLRRNQGHLLGLADHLMNNHDRHVRNWLVADLDTDDEALVGIDHATAFRTERPGADSPFSEQFYEPDPASCDWRVTDHIGFHPEDFVEARRRLEALGPVFEQRGRGSWHATTLRRLSELEPHAAGGTRRLPTPGPREWPTVDPDSEAERPGEMSHLADDAMSAAQAALGEIVAGLAEPPDTDRPAPWRGEDRTDDDGRDQVR